MRRRLNRLWMWGLLAVVAAGVAVTVGMIGHRQDRPALPTDFLGDQPTQLPTGDGEPAPDPQRPPIPEIVGPPKSGIANVPTVEELESICPDPWTNPPAECSDALDRRYMLEGVRIVRLHYGGFNWAPRPQPLSHEIPWREAFADPVRTRLAVEEALANPDCLDPPAGSVALRETCAADEMAKLAMITEGCVMPLIMAGLLDSSSPADQEPIDTHFRSRRQLDTPTIRDEMWFWHIEMLDDDTSLTQEQYWHRRIQVEDGRFRFAWRLNQCRRLPREALHWLTALPEPTGRVGEEHQGAHLRAAAARLGNEWAIALAERRQEAPH